MRASPSRSSRLHRLLFARSDDAPQILGVEVPPSFPQIPQESAVEKGGCLAGVDLRGVERPELFEATKRQLLRVEGHAAGHAKGGKPPAKMEGVPHGLGGEADHAVVSCKGNLPHPPPNIHFQRPVEVLQVKRHWRKPAKKHAGVAQTQVLELYIDPRQYI